MRAVDPDHSRKIGGLQRKRLNGYPKMFSAVIVCLFIWSVSEASVYSGLVFAVSNGENKNGVDDGLLLLDSSDRTQKLLLKTSYPFFNFHGRYHLLRHSSNISVAFGLFMGLKTMGHSVIYFAGLGLWPTFSKIKKSRVEFLRNLLWTLDM